MSRFIVWSLLGTLLSYSVEAAVIDCFRFRDTLLELMEDQRNGRRTGLLVKNSRGGSEPLGRCAYTCGYNIAAVALKSVGLDPPVRLVEEVAAIAKSMNEAGYRFIDRNNILQFYQKLLIEILPKGFEVNASLHEFSLKSAPSLMSKSEADLHVFFSKFTSLENRTRLNIELKDGITTRLFLLAESDFDAIQKDDRRPYGHVVKLIDAITEKDQIKILAQDPNDEARVIVFAASPNFLADISSSEKITFSPIYVVHPYTGSLKENESPLLLTPGGWHIRAGVNLTIKYSEEEK